MLKSIPCQSKETSAVYDCAIIGNYAYVFDIVCRIPLAVNVVEKYPGNLIGLAALYSGYETFKLPIPSNPGDINVINHRTGAAL